MEKDTNKHLSNYIPTDADYEKAETDQLCAALKRNYSERFLVMTKLMKMNEMLKKARIIRTPYTLDK